MKNYHFPFFCIFVQICDLTGYSLGVVSVDITFYHVENIIFENSDMSIKQKRSGTESNHL